MKSCIWKGMISLELCDAYIKLIRENGKLMTKKCKNVKMGKSDQTLSTFVQHVEDFKFWVNAAERAHRFPKKEIAKMFVTGLKPH